MYNTYQHLRNATHTETATGLRVCSLSQYVDTFNDNLSHIWYATSVHHMPFIILNSGDVCATCECVNYN